MRKIVFILAVAVTLTVISDQLSVIGAPTSDGSTSSNRAMAAPPSRAIIPPLPGNQPSRAPVSRPARWATPLERPGLPNLFKVSDTLYRGAQPSAEGFRELKKLGIKTVINLRSFHSDTDLAAGSGLAIENIPVKAWHPEKEDIVRFLRLVKDKTRQPVFVHCQYGADRTGVMCAIYRIVVDGWSRDEAIEELTQGGFGFHAVLGNLIDFLRDLNIDEIRKEAGIPKTPKKSDRPPKLLKV